MDMNDTSNPVACWGQHFYFGQ